ncbi:MAG TPA: histidine phosphatase family protein [Nitrospirae bacterium]|nr:phosphoserine phosphatase 1 [bacterium BMS3Bbin08]HDH00375.1 histidine phosphatase family protein [Nitrospirota bacterium]HDO25885.1 histidine phosphatase family protein [Nitrospirota bacterium]
MHTKLYLIRHGETEGADAKRYKGHIDVPLSQNGVRQMQRLSKYIHKLIAHSSQSTELNAVYTSDLSRAVKSAEIIAKPHGLKPVVIKDLKERNFGIWEGMSFDEIKHKYSEEFDAWTDNPLKFSPMRGESTVEVKDRAIAALGKILSKHNYQSTDKNSPGSENIAIVSHGGINRIVLCHLLGIPLENIFRIEQDFAAVNIIEFYDDYPVVKLINYRVPSKQPAGKQNTERRTQTGKIQNA